ncbi:MAG: hypothetical protein NVS4B11_02410 [Ktedonobacteraceae bacterium]
MGGSNFDLIAQDLLKQKYIMEQMEEENRELRRQLADLREGRGIFVEIDGRRFALSSEFITPQVTTVAATSVAVEQELQPDPVVAQQNEVLDKTEGLVMSIPETSRPMIDFFADDEEAEAQTTGPTFLEEVMIDEFASAATSPLAVWSAPKQEEEKKPEATADEEMATLRRQLIGSYLLE